ncbi:MAG: peptidoglycan DD-metalloendopeptidase family protein, partial [bacterium]
KIFILALIPLIAFGRVENERDKLLKIEDEIKKIDASLKATSEKKERTKSKINELSQSQNIKKKNLKSLEGDIKKISKRIDITDERIVGLTKQISTKKEGLSIVVRRLFDYKTSKNPFWEDREKEGLFGILIDELSISIEGRELEKKGEIVKKEGLKVVLNKTEDQKKKTVSDIKKQEQEIVLQNKALSEIKKNEEKLQKRINKLKQDQKKLEALIKRLEAERKTTGRERPGKPVGSLIWPVKSRNITREFGRYTHPEAGTIIFNKGIDISAPLGSSVFAVSDGEVVYADYFMGYGRLVMIDHNGSLYSLYGHLDSFNVRTGQRVAKGDVIGSVGKSGDAESPTLHFEIRENGEARDPLDWIR